MGIVRSVDANVVAEQVPSRPQAELTIVIPAKNEIHYLPKLLASLAKQNYPDLAQIPIYIADAGSTDGTREAALNFRDRLQVEVIAGGLPSVGRNAGARLAESRYVLFLDADVELADPTLLSRSLRMVRRRHLHCATTSIRCISDKKFDAMLYLANNFMQRLGSFIKPFGTGMFLLFDLDVFNRLGGFDESALFAEDYQLTRRVSPMRFGIVRGHILTSNRRFMRTGRSRMMWLFLRSILNTWNEEYFLKDHGYWEQPKSARHS